MTIPHGYCLKVALAAGLFMRGLCTEARPQAPLGGEKLKQRIVHSDPAKYRDIPKVHAGAGTLSYVGLLGPQDFNTNLIFLHRGILHPKSGIGHHFHNQMEEMFVIFDNKAQFTIDGRTAELTGPAGAPCRMGSSHGIYNPTDQPTEWMNIAVGSVRGRYDAFDLGDDRVGVAIDTRPVFMNMRLDKSLLKPVAAVHGGKGSIKYRRAFGPEVFRTNWGYVDHVLIPRGSSLGYHRHDLQEEIYYVISGRGKVTVDEETTDIALGDALPIRLHEAHALESTPQHDLELMVIGIALEKGRFDAVDVALPALGREER
jgi:mannose-6-phosphate isomerase-like protein (cupin superfamily)